MRTALVIVALGITGGCAPTPPTVGVERAPSVFTAEAWPEADALFRDDPFWLGADGAWSIDLGDERVLWLFADSFVDPKGSGSRSGASVTMVSNTVAVQRGYDPSRATVRFFWGRDDAGNAQAFIPDDGDVRHWPGDAVHIGDTLLIFLMHVRSTEQGIGFEVFDWSAVAIVNPDDEPDAWRIERIATPGNNAQVIVGSAGLLVDAGWLYAFGSKEPGTGRIFLSRFPLADARAGDLETIEWWSTERGWIDGPDAAALATPVFEHFGTECTVHRDGESRDFLNLHTIGFGKAELAMRTATAITGPWSEDSVLYSPPENAKEDAMIYQGKAHPHLVGADLVATYCSNTFEFARLLLDDAIYYPRFVRLTRRR